MKPGDHLVVPLFFGLTHHGICVGPRRVVHWDSGIAGRVGLLSLLLGPTKARVRETSLLRFASGGRVRVRRYRLALDADTVVARARARVGERGYHLLTNNCEHFAEWSRFGVSRSPQIARWIALPVAIARWISSAVDRFSQGAVEEDVCLS